MSCIADVFTNAEYGVCLEVGVSLPYKIYVALNDHSGKRIATGYVPSYNEFYQQLSNGRLTDEEWKKIVEETDDMSSYRPEWIKGCVLSK